MNKKLHKALQDKCKDFGLTEKAIEELAELGSEGLTDDTSDEDITKKADSLVPIAKAMQAEITRKTRKPNQKPSKSKSSKSEDGDEDGDEGDETDDEELEKLPKGMRAYMKKVDAAIDKLQKENETLKAEKAAGERKSHVTELARKAGVSDKMMEAQLALHDAYENGDDDAVNAALAQIKQVSVTEKLPSADDTSILSSSEQAMKDDADAWANSLPDAK